MNTSPHRTRVRETSFKVDALSLTICLYKKFSVLIKKNQLESRSTTVGKTRCVFTICLFVFYCQLFFGDLFIVALNCIYNRISYVA